MMNIKSKVLLAAAVLSASAAFAQEQVRSSSSQYLPAYAKPDVSISYAISGEGKRFAPTWGLDQAWINEQNLRKGINHMGRENIGLGRSAFRFTKPLINDSELDNAVISVMRQRNTVFDILSPTLPIVFTADQEAGTTDYYVVNKSANVDHWAAMINAHVRWMQNNTQHPVVGISPFNEGDYWTVEEGATATKQYQVAKKLKEDYPACADIPMVGGNTLNNDQALAWYTSGKAYYDWGNTHQLAGGFNTFAGFYQQLEKDGKIGYGDEMHNVGESMIGLEYGMTVGIWWGFDSRARGEFCDISRNGVRLAYGEHRDNWTASSVYRHDDGRVKIFMGSSERQAYTTNYQFVSSERDVYYDGYGPVREFMMEMPGGTGYQKGQTNAERVIDVTWGEDVAPGVIDGTYKIVNKATGNILSVSGSSVMQQKDNNKNTQHWKVYPISSRIGGDFSFYGIESLSNSRIHMNVRDFSTFEGADIIAYQQDNFSSNEQWYLEYVGEGYYYIRNRESALYLASATSSTFTNTKVTQTAMQTGDTHDRLLWRFLPTTVAYETVAPAKPTGLGAVAHPASVTLMWDENGESDLEGYMVLRAPKGTTDWNTIARKVTTNYFTDNTCRQGDVYIYKVKAIDLAQNLSAASDEVEAAPTAQPALVAHYAMDENIYDATSNMMDAACSEAPVFVAGPKDDMKALSVATGRYLQLPYGIADSDELTVGMWVNWRSTGSWPRIFDFGYDTDHYLFLTPSSGSSMRFAIKNGGDEQTVDCKSKLETNTWKHVVVTMGKTETNIYVDGEVAASSTGITIRPSDVRPVLNYIGRSQFVADSFLSASLSDIRIYNYALTAEEVKQMMEGSLTDGIKATQAEEQETPVIYGLDGIKRTELRQGLNILNGKKVIKN